MENESKSTRAGTELDGTDVRIGLSMDGRSLFENGKAEQNSIGGS